VRPNRRNLIHLKEIADFQGLAIEFVWHCVIIAGFSEDTKYKETS